jgi:hypothetical protein
VGELAAAASFGGAFPGASDVAGDAVSALADFDRGAAVALHVGHGFIVSSGVKFEASRHRLRGRFGLGRRAGGLGFLEKRAVLWRNLPPFFEEGAPARSLAFALFSCPAMGLRLVLLLTFGRFRGRGAGDRARAAPRPPRDLVGCGWWCPRGEGRVLARAHVGASPQAAR